MRPNDKSALIAARARGYVSERTKMPRALKSGDDFKVLQRKFAAYQARMRANPTRAEFAVKCALDTLGIRYVFQKGFLRGKTLRIVDFYISKPVMLCIEVDGKYHEHQVSYDAYREREIKLQRRKDVRFVRVTNEWVFSQSDLAASIRSVLDAACR